MKDRAAWLAVALAALLCGCGYPGEPLPPALNRPVRVNDLSLIQRGPNLIVRFTVPRLTTEGSPIPGAPDIEIRAGEMPSAGWSDAAWEKASRRIPDSEMKVGGRIVNASIDVSKDAGKTIVVGTQILGPKGRSAGWTVDNVVVVPPLPDPQGLAAKNAPDAVQLDWHAAAPGFRVFRKDPGEDAPRQIAIVDKPTYVDPGIEFGKTYEYSVQSMEQSADKYAESAVSPPVLFAPRDEFPPAVPSGLTVVPGARSMELVWERNTEKDLASYRVYRNGMKIADDLTSPSYSDRDVGSGAAYRYEVTALDRAGNESARSAAVEAAMP
ncbi:MAG: hypothetical protein KGN84_08520 [Acidobacteriota bacterium]|nr:hypothetical protein [Acidobacteriota bacterium]